MKVKIFTIFPELFPGSLGTSVINKALKNEIWQYEVINLRNYAKGSHSCVDDTCFGGGPGMVMRADVIDNALLNHYKGVRECGAHLLYLSPRGEVLTQELVKTISRYKEIGILCGRFEGVDQRILEYWKFREISLGDFILSNGDLATQVLLDACIRVLPGVLGKQDSLQEESFDNGLLEYPHYTKPRVWNDCAVPEILLSGNHLKIKEWRYQKSQQITKLKRPDLWSQYLKDKGQKI